MKIQAPLHRHDGFSLLELVVAVSIMLILGVIGFVAYQNYTDNARQAAVDSAASQAFTAVVAADTAGDQDVHSVITKFNETSSDDITTDVQRHIEHLTVIANGWEKYYAVESTDPNINDIEDVYQANDDGADINEFADGQLVFVSTGGNLFVDGLSDNATITYEDNSPVNISAGGFITLTQSGQYTINGGFKNIGHRNARPNITEVSTWTETGTVDTSYMFNRSANLQSTVQPPSTVTDVSYMFGWAIYYNQDISDWDMSNVQNMYGMFTGAARFVGEGIGAWDTSSVTNMHHVFHSAKDFNGNVSDWDVSNVTTMEGMFRDAQEYNNGGEPLQWEDASKVRTFNNMFHGAKDFNQDISEWDISNITTMRYMLYGADSFTYDLSGWNVEHVRDAYNFVNPDTTKLTLAQQPAFTDAARGA